MKKNLILCLGIVLIASCTNPNNQNNRNVRESQEYLQLRAELDSLRTQSAIAEAEAAEMIAVINEVEANFDRIRQAERIISLQSVSGEMSVDATTRVNENFQMIHDILQRNRAQLAELEHRTQGQGSNEVALLQNTIARLNRELEESTARLAELRNELAQRDAQIAQLAQDITDLAIEAEQQAMTIQEQERAMNTAFFVFGTMHELRNSRILSGGFLQQTRVLQDAFNRDLFIRIDIRETTEIPLYARRANVWSTHPNGTFQLVAGDDRNLTLVITDVERFWSLTRHLIVEVR